MLNNTKVRVTYPLEELLQIAYKQLAKQNLVPYTHPSYPINYDPRYHVKNGEGKIVNNVDEVTVTFGLALKNAEPEYQAGDWKDPEVDKIINNE